MYLLYSISRGYLDLLYLFDILLKLGDNGINGFAAGICLWTIVSLDTKWVSTHFLKISVNVPSYKMCSFYEAKSINKSASDVQYSGLWLLFSLTICCFDHSSLFNSATDESWFNHICYLMIWSQDKLWYSFHFFSFYFIAAAFFSWLPTSFSTFHFIFVCKLV